MATERECDHCGLGLTGKRNKRFCSKECSNNYWNDKNYEQRKRFESTESRLRANYKNVKRFLKQYGSPFQIEKDKAHRFFKPEFITYSCKDYNLLYDVKIITQNDRYEFNLR